MIKIAMYFFLVFQYLGQGKSVWQTWHDNTSMGFANVHVVHSFSNSVVCSGELDHGTSALPNSVPLKPFPSLFFFLDGSSPSDVRSTSSSASLRSRVSLAKIFKDPTVALLSWSSCPRKKSR